MKLGRFMKKKGALVAIGGIVVVAGIGVTWAVTHDLSVINNDLALANYQTTFTENFTSPPNWQTCQTVPKTITVTNNSGVDVAVRIKLEEDWIASDGVTHLPVVSAASGLTMAQINFTANSGWTKDGQYYVYDTDLAPNATTNSLTTGVTLNCDANLDESADGAYGGAEYHLKATIQTIQADKKDEWDPPTLADEIIKQANAPYAIDFTRKAIVSDDEYTRNGNGVNKYTENGQDVYYFRGQIDNNNVIWADKCWKIIRTTYTGGVKMIYNGVPTEVDGARRCSATGADSQISVNVGGVDKNIFVFNTDHNSPADVGYMYGTRIAGKSLSVGAATFTFSNDVSRSGNTYTLDTSAGQFITGTWADERMNAAIRYHYFCTDGTASCDGTKIGYIYEYNAENGFRYLPVNGYDDIEAMKVAMNTNTTDSYAKTIIEAWFETEGLIDYEDELEDVIFCNDRSFYSGALKSKDSDATPSGATVYSHYSARGRNAVRNAHGNIKPSLDCPSKNDSFTKDDTTKGNGKLNHKVGLITEDELTMAGNGILGYDTTSYLYYGYGRRSWSASPYGFQQNYAYGFKWESISNDNTIDEALGLRPLVSLNAGTTYISGTGLRTDPYIVP